MTGKFGTEAEVKKTVKTVEADKGWILTEIFNHGVCWVIVMQLSRIPGHDGLCGNVFLY